MKGQSEWTSLWDRRYVKPLTTFCPFLISLTVDLKNFALLGAIYYCRVESATPGSGKVTSKTLQTIKIVVKLIFRNFRFMSG